MIDTKELRRLAQAATPGPWINHGRQPNVAGLPHSAVAAKTLLARVYSEAYGDVEQETANASFIAAANPAAVSELLDRLEAAKSDALEQARLNGMGSEREAKHLAQIAALEKERDAMRAELDALLAWKEEAERQEPVGVLHVGSWYGEELQDWEFEADQTACDRLNEAHQHKEASLSLYARPVPAPSVPDERAAFDAWRHDGAWCRADDAGEWEAWQARAKLAAAPKPEETK